MINREEIIAGLKFTIEMILFDPSTGENIDKAKNVMDKITLDACRGAIELLKQEPKIGKWMVSMDCEGKTRQCTCNLCGYETGQYTWENPYFCENCGAKMEKEDQDE